MTARDTVNIRELRESNKARTQEKWHVSGLLGCEGFIRPHDDMPPLLVPGNNNDNWENDVAHVCAAVNTLPDLLDELEALRTMYDNLQEHPCPLCKGWPGEADGSCPHCVKLLNIMGDVMALNVVKKEG